jgi:hypothetical protein
MSRTCHPQCGREERALIPPPPSLSDRNFEFQVNNVVTSWELGHESNWPLRASRASIQAAVRQERTYLFLYFTLFNSAFSAASVIRHVRTPSSLYRSPHIVKMVKSRKIQHAGHVARMRETSKCSLFNDVFSSSDKTASNERMIVNN